MIPMIPVTLYLLQLGYGIISEELLKKVYNNLIKKIRGKKSAYDELKELFFKSFSFAISLYTKIDENRIPEWWDEFFSAMVEQQELDDMSFYEINSYDKILLDLETEPIPEYINEIISMFLEFNEIPDNIREAIDNNRKQFLLKLFRRYRSLLTTDPDLSYISLEIQSLKNSINKLLQNSRALDIDNFRQAMIEYKKYLKSKAEQELENTENFNGYLFKNRKFRRTIHFSTLSNENDIYYSIGSDKILDIINNLRSERVGNKDIHNITKDESYTNTIETIHTDENSSMKHKSHGLRVFIPGNMGYGKTVFTWQLISGITNEDIIPIRIPCNRVSELNDTQLFNIIYKEIGGEKYNINRDDIRQLIFKGFYKIFLIFDGLDEASVSVFNFISDMANSNYYSNFGIIITGRPHVFRPEHFFDLRASLPGYVYWVELYELELKQVLYAIDNANIPGRKRTYAEYKKLLGSNIKWMNNPLYLGVILQLSNDVLKSITNEYLMLKHVAWNLITRELIKYIHKDFIEGNKDIIKYVNKFWTSQTLRGDLFRDRELLKEIIDLWFKEIAVCITFGLKPKEFREMQLLDNRIHTYSFDEDDNRSWLNIREIFNNITVKKISEHLNSGIGYRFLIAILDSIISFIEDRDGIQIDRDIFRDLIDSIIGYFWIFSGDKGYIFVPDRFRDLFVVEYILSNDNKILKPIILANTQILHNITSLLETNNITLLNVDSNPIINDIILDIAYKEYVSILKLKKYLPEDFYFGFRNIITNDGHVIGIYINKCNLIELPSVINDFSEIEYLDLSQNSIKSFDMSIKPIFINLSQNQLTKFPESICIDTLKDLDLSHNKIENLPDKISEMINLESLNLSWNMIQELPRSIGNLRKLQAIELSINNIGGLPDEFCLLENLNEFNMNGYQLDSLPDNFGNLKSLNKLDLNKNEIAKLPESFCNLINLHYLYLQENELVELPEDFGKLSNLEDLVLCCNQLKKLPASIVQIDSLQILDIRYNKILDIPAKLKNMRDNGMLTILDEPQLEK